LYKTAIRCAVNEDLKEEWDKNLDQTRAHEQMVRTLLETMRTRSGEGNSGARDRPSQGRSVDRDHNK
jgi:hypothetical protein